MTLNINKIAITRCAHAFISAVLLYQVTSS